MSFEAVERLCDAAVRTATAWGVLGARQLRSAVAVLGAAAVAQGEARWILSRGEHELSPEEDAVLQKYDLHNTGFHLTALAIESLLRCLPALRGAPAKTSTRPGLAALARAAGLDLTAEDRGLLADLSELIAWHTRPPARMVVERHGRYLTASPRVKRFYLGESVFTADLPWPECLDPLVERLSRELAG